MRILNVSWLCIQNLVDIDDYMIQYTRNLYEKPFVVDYNYFVDFVVIYCG